MSKYLYRPRVDAEVQERMNNFLNKFQLNDQNLGRLNNIAAGIGMECLERLMDNITNEFKQTEIGKTIFKTLESNQTRKDTPTQ